MSYSEVVRFDSATDWLGEVQLQAEHVRRGVLRWRVDLQHDDPESNYFEVFLHLSTVLDFEDGCSLLECTEHCGDRQDGEQHARQIMGLVDDLAQAHNLHVRTGKIEIP